MRFPSKTIGLCLIVVLSSLPSAGNAQLGGLVKKAKDKVAPDASGQSSTDQPARLPGPEITPGTVDHFLAGLKAEKTAKDQAAAAEKERKDQEAQAHMDPNTRYYSCVSDKQQKDPQQATMQQMAKDAKDASDKGDTQKAMDIAMKLGPMSQDIQKRAQAACASAKAAPPAPTPEQQAVQNAPQVTPEAAGAKAAGLTTVEYGQVKELIYTYLNYGKRSGVTDPEKQAIEAKRADLKAAFTSIGM